MLFQSWPAARTLALLTAVLQVLSTGVFAVCPNPCHCDDSKLIARCLGSHLDIVPITFNPGIKQLHLKNNNIHSIERDLAFYEKLQFLDLSSNKLVTLGETNFLKQKILKILYISHNKISKLSSGSFLGLESLTTLDLSHNFITTVPQSCLKDLVALRKLSLMSNRIHTIEAEALLGPKHLLTLNLRDNNLKDLLFLTEKCLEPLVDLDLSSNLVEKISPWIFQKLIRLEKLSLNGMGLSEVPEDSLNGLKSLRILKLQENNITTIPSAPMPAAKRLQELYLGGNMFRKVSSEEFPSMKYLRVLELSTSRQLTSVYTRAFAALPNLETLIMNHNPKLVHLGSLSYLHKLKRLVLQYNALQTIDVDSLPLHSLETLDLSDNPWNCNCSLKWLRDLVNAPNKTVVLKSVTCVTPAKLNTKNLSSLDDTDLQCNAMKRTMVILGVIVSVILCALMSLAYAVHRYRLRLRPGIQDKLSERTISSTWKEPDFTPSTIEEEYIYQTSQGIKAIPVTEL